MWHSRTAHFDFDMPIGLLPGWLPSSPATARPRCPRRVDRPTRGLCQAAAVLSLLCACFPVPADEFSTLWREAERSAGIPILVPGDRQLPVSSGPIEFDPVSPRDRAAAAAYLRLYRQELSKYPAAFLARVNVE
jgi:hypothetical protein